MAIAEVQKRRILEEITRAFFSAGEKPTLTEILREGSDFFARFPIGKPLSVDRNHLVSGFRSDVDKFNEMFARLALNIDVLYEVCSDQVEEVMQTTTLMRTELERLKARRAQLISQIDDKLFTLYNTDGYYYSLSDTFTTVDLVDLKLTSAFIDTEAGLVQLPTLSSLTKRIGATQVNGTAVSVDINGNTGTFKTLGNIDGAYDGLTNTLWAIEVTTDSPAEVITRMTIGVDGTSQDVKLSRVDFDPYGITAVQAFVETNNLQQDDLAAAITPGRTDFSDHIQTSTFNMSFVDTGRRTDTVYITLRKTEADFTENANGAIRYHYIFGAKNIVMTEQIYDAVASLVTQPLSLETDLVGEQVIDALSLVSEEFVPEGTELTFYVAPNVGSDVGISDFDWKRITPLDNINENPNSVVSFNGSRRYSKKITPNPTGTDLQLLAPDNNNPDLTKRNPSAKIVEDAFIWRVTAFDEEGILSNSILLEEGVNSTRIYYTPLDSAGLTLLYWKDYISGTKTTNTVYGAIDTGNEFFYGGDVGEAGKSVYVETYIECEADQPLLLKELTKGDPNSRVWDIKVFLNGREIGNLPVGTDKLLIPWKFQEGINHIILLVQIPAVTTAYPNPYVGIIDLMTDDDLYDFGTVKLATWNYVDFFKMQFNEVSQPYTFTIFNNEIVSRRKPTTNFRVKYSKSTDLGPDAVRLRVDFSREVNSPNVTPVLKSYRLRFLYG